MKLKTLKLLVLGRYWRW